MGFYYIICSVNQTYPNLLSDGLAAARVAARIRKLGHPFRSPAPFAHALLYNVTGYQSCMKFKDNGDRRQRTVAEGKVFN